MAMIYFTINKKISQKESDLLFRTDSNFSVSVINSETLERIVTGTAVNHVNKTTLISIEVSNDLSDEELIFVRNFYRCALQVLNNVVLDYVSETK